jgi:predicted DsbA family dithiol-disulfide isomerase
MNDYTGNSPTPPAVRVDILSDVVCPWCIVGYRQLEQALARLGIAARVTWHPFELNPEMPPEGQNLRQHLIAKYGITAEQSARARDDLTRIGAELGFAFEFTDDMRMVNTFAAHRLLDWAFGEGRQHPLQMALFAAHFSQRRDVSDMAVLTDIAASVGLDADAARAVLQSGAHGSEVRQKQKAWIDQGASGVPTMVFDGRFALTGAQGIDTYAQVLARCLGDRAKARSAP